MVAKKALILCLLVLVAGHATASISAPTGTGSTFVPDMPDHLHLARPIAELERSTPEDAWLTPRLVETLESGTDVPIDEIPGFPYTSTDAAAYDEQCTAVCPPLPYSAIRPGAALGITQVACTANFVFENGDRLAIGTAGHCTDVGELHQTLLVDPMKAIGFRTLGETIYSTGDGGVGTDFALIEIFPRYHDLVSAAVTIADGPCGIGTGTFGKPAQQYGHGLAWGAGGQPRNGASLGSSAHYGVFALAPGISWGDSGSPAVFGVTKEAAAVITHAIPMTPYGVGTTLPRALDLLGSAGHTGWSLLDSPNCLA